MARLETALTGELASLRAADLYRDWRRLASAQGPRVTVNGRELLNFSSNDYLGLANSAPLRAAAIAALEQFGTGAGASRLVCGNLDLYTELESELARFKGAAASIVFSSGYAANVGTITALVGAGDVVILDKLDHASIIDGARLSGAALRVYPHRDLDRLAALLQWAAARPPVGDRPCRVLVVTESVFSMDGDLAPLREIVALKERYGAWLMVDEAHAVGLYGPHRRGLAEAVGAEAGVDVTLGTLSKALGGQGGYVAGSQPLVDYLRNRARSLIYSTALPPATLAAALAAVRLVTGDEGQERRDRLWRNVSLLKNGLAAAGRPTDSRSAIVPLIVGEEAAALALARHLEAGGILAPAIRYPTVPRGRARLRLTVSAAHTPADIDQLLAALADVRPS